MTYGHLGTLPKPVSKMVIGSTPFGGMDDDAVFRVLDRYFELGGRGVDTAHIYGPKSSGPIGRWMESRGVRDEMVISDKVCHPYGHPRLNLEDMESDLQQNLERLRTSTIDVLVFHRDDPSVDLLPILERLNEWISSGVIRGFGASNWTIPRIEEGNRIAAEHGLQGFWMSNPQLSLATVNEAMWAGAMTIDREGRAWHERTQFPLYSWSSVGGGFFAGVDTPDVRRVYHNEENFARKARLARMAVQKGYTPTQLALAWVLNQPFPVFALVGCHTPEMVEENAEATEIELSPEELEFLESGQAR